MLEVLCRDVIGLPQQDIELLSRLASTIQYTADLAGADIFIDCFYENGTKCMVVAEANPQGDLSAYGRNVVGEEAEKENEPAVFGVLATGLPMRDLRAKTQENKLVRQDAIPIRNSDGVIIAALIREKDVSAQVIHDKKYAALADMKESLNEGLLNTGYPAPRTLNDPLIMTEIHHRIKNNLQMVASILNMQARRTADATVKNAFKENVGRVLSFAAIHEIMTSNGLEEELSILDIIGKVHRNTAVYSNHEEKKLLIKTEGADFLVSAENASSIALVVNELLANAVEHAFIGRPSGTIVVSVNHGSQYSSVVVADDGTGFNFKANGGGNLGLAIVEMTVKERLKGKLKIFSDGHGSRIQFDFKN